jgi:hypothetical protein
LDKADVQLWGGLLNDNGNPWVPAAAELLWAGTGAYLTGQPAADDPNTLVVTRARIVTAPPLPRAALLNYPPLAAAIANGTSLALIGSQTEQGVYLLEQGGDVQQLWGIENEASWVSGDDAAGLLLHAPDLPTGLNTFSWVRTDGTGIRINAQPFHHVRGVAGDAYGGIWWIETPQAALDQWQLWHYDPAGGRIALRLQANGALLSSGSRIVNPSLTPVLLAARPDFAVPAGELRVELIMDTLDNASQQLYMGIFRLTVVARLDTQGEGAVEGIPQLLLAPEDYRGPLQISPDQGRLAYFVYDPQVISLTSGFLRPANTVRVLTLEGRGANTIRTVYAVANRFEFLSPTLGWQGNDRLYLARSRFAVIQVQLPAPGEQSAGSIATGSYLLPSGKQLRDLTTCRDAQSALLVAQANAESLELARWPGDAALQPLFALPPNLGRVFVCWRGP